MLRAETLLWPLDAVREAALRLLARLLGPGRVRPLLTQPDLRVAIGGSLSVGVALGMTLYCPLLLLAVSPLVLGVPHLLADVRYLVAQPGYHRRLRLALPVGVALAAAALGMGMRAGLIAIAAALLLSGKGAGRLVLLRRVLGLGLVAAAAIFGLCTEWYWLELGLAHVHNFVAILLFYLWRPRTRALHLWPLALFALGGAALMAGSVPLGAQALAGFAGHETLSADGQRAWLAPGLGTDWATRLVLLFAFAQAVHYTVWLRLIPEEARERPAPRPFRASLRALHRDLGAPLLLLATVVGVALAVWGTVELSAARMGYFQVAAFHGYLELCVLGVWWIEGRPARSAASR